MTTKQPEYKNLQRYKKQKGVNTQSLLSVFVTTFFVMLIFFIGAAKHMTPNVDVAIGEDSAAETKETGLGVKGFIDNRLRNIQSEDSSIVAKKLESKYETEETEQEQEENYFTKELEERVIIPAKKIKQEVTKKEEQENVEAKAETPQPKAEVPPAITTTTYKVYIGSYHSIEQAKVAQSILQESTLAISPFIKNLNGTYTLQAGSFNSQEKAQELVKELLRNNYPARMVKD